MSPKRKKAGKLSSASKMKKQQQSSTGNETNSGGSSSSRDNGEEEDRISSLPDTILHHILSYLDMKHVVQTCILSKRWTHLWASLGNLTFDSELFHSPKKRRCDGFIDFVDQVLFLRDKYSDIQMFHLMNVFGKCEVNIRLYTWIISVIKSKVQELRIGVVGDELRLPIRLFTCNSLTRMTLGLASKSGRWSITLPTDDSSMCLPNLWDLQLVSVSFHDENLTNKFFLSFPNLEELDLNDVEFLHMNINISCLKLRDLAVDNHVKDYGYCHWPNTKFKLHAPNLSYFTCNDYMSKDYILEDLSSLVKADIHMKVEEEEDLPADKKQMYAQRMMQCLKALRHVEDLKLSPWFLEVVSGSPDILEGEPGELCYLTCLRLETWLSVDTICAIAYLLNISPYIKSLFLKITKVGGSQNEGDYLEAEMSFQCLLDKLEIVEIQGVVGCANELNFLQVLLKNANVLKKLVVCTSTEPSPDRQKRFMKFTKKLLMFPRASSNITILFF